MSVGDAATLIPIRHDWSSPVEVEPHTPTSVLPHDDGSEQRLLLSHVSTERVTYRPLPPTSREATTFLALVDLATDAWVRVPRWEDEARVSAAVSAGSGVSIPCVTSNKPTFATGRQVILWRSATEWEVTTVDSFTASEVVADLVDDWAAGTIIVPVMPGRLALPLSLSHWVPTTGALQCVVDFDLRDIAGVGTGGTSVAGVPDAITVTSALVGKYGRAALRATVTDAEGNVLAGQPIVWTSADPTDAPCWASSDPHVVIVENPNGVLDTVAITATLGAVNDSGSAFLVG
jgi:hypothetical protein